MANWQHLQPNACVLSGGALTSEGETKDTPAHVIASALGGRYKPCGILSLRGNNYLARRVDAPFIEIFGHSMTYLAKISRDRGKSNETKVKDVDGKEWVFSFGKDAIHPSRAIVNVAKLDDGSIPIEFSGTEEQLVALLKSLGRLDVVEQCLSLARRVSEPSPELNLGIRPVKGGCVTLSAWTTVALFAAAKLQIQSPLWQDYISGTSLDTATAPTVRFSPGAVSFNDDYGTLAHAVALWNDSQRQSLYGYVQTFGGMGMIVCFARGWTSDVRTSYCVDPLTGKQGAPEFTIRSSGIYFDRINAKAVKDDVEGMFGRIKERILDNTGGTARVVMR